MFIFDGHSTIIELLGFGGITLKEKTVTPPGYDGGGPNDTTNMRLKVLRTKQPKKLKSLDKTNALVFYNADQLQLYLLAINVVQYIRVTFPDGNRVKFYGWLNTFKHAEHKEGEPPCATIEIEPTNQDPANGNESLPVWDKVAAPPP
jgi:hypothetical protein